LDLFAFESDCAPEQKRGEDGKDDNDDVMVMILITEKYYL
jgi:hypothetical protein